MAACMSKQYRLGFIGAGKLAGSVIRGLVRARYCGPHAIIAYEPSDAARAALEQDVAIMFAGANREVAHHAETIFIAVKPGVVLSVLREIADDLEERLVISLAAGVRLAAIEATGPARFMRVLTNTPSTVCQGASAVVSGTKATEDDVRLVREMFAAIGVAVEIGEEQIDAVTALSGSGPAFVYSVIEGLAEGGEKVGLSPEVALTLATQTVLGAGQLALESKLSPEELRRMVVTPGGTTAAGLKIMQEMRTMEGLIGAVEAAVKRADEMAKENR